MKPHRLDGLSFTFGIIFLGVVAWWLFGAQFDVELPSGGWFVAGALILFGVVGLIGALRPDRAKSEPSSPQPVSVPPMVVPPVSVPPLSTQPTSGQPTSAQPAYQVSPAPLPPLDDDLDPRNPRTGDSTTTER